MPRMVGAPRFQGGAVGGVESLNMVKPPRTVAIDKFANFAGVAVLLSCHKFDNLPLSPYTVPVFP